MKRRTFLRHAGHSLAIPGIMGSLGMSLPSSQAFAKMLKTASDSGRVLVLIYLEGGNDGLNTVVPLSQLSNLNAVRPQVILPDDSLQELDGTGLGLHPELADFKSLYEEGRLSIVQSVGYPEQDFSHFRSTDIWMSGSDSDELVTTGWAGRLANEEHPDFPVNYPNTSTPDPLAIEVGFGASLLFQGPTSAMSMVINNPEFFYQLIDNVEQEVPDTSAGEKLRYLRLVANQSQVYGQVVRDAANKVPTQKPYSDTFLSQQLKIVARMIKGGIQTPLYLVRLGGFDTHDAQVVSTDHTKGEHANLLKELNDGVMEFMNDLQFLGIDDQVVGMTFSEFGRRIVSNASLGTDHGSAAPMFIFGNGVKKGVLGDTPKISRNSTYNDNLEMQYDFRQIYASLMEQWLNKDSSISSSVLFKNFDTLPIIGEEEQVTSLLSESQNPTFNVYPNPLNGQAKIDFLSDGNNMSIQLIDQQGRLVEEVFAGTLASGRHQVSWNTSHLSRGNYFVVINGSNMRIARSVMKQN